MPREDVQDQHRAIDDRQRDDFFQILALPRPQVVENQNQAGAQRLGLLCNLVCLSAADQRGRVHFCALLHDASGDLYAGRGRERFQFRQLGFERPRGIAGVNRDDQRGGAYRAIGRSRSMSHERA